MIIVALLACCLFFVSKDPGATKSETEGASVEAGKKVAVDAAEAVFLPITKEAVRLNSPDYEVSEDIALVEMLLLQYRRTYGTNPVGLNHEIVAKLAGNNAKRAAYLAPDHAAINQRGELEDRWGTPFFFHQLSAREMEVISAGPDRQLWTEDDVKSDL